MSKVFQLMLRLGDALDRLPDVLDLWRSAPPEVRRDWADRQPAARRRQFARCGFPPRLVELAVACDFARDCGIRRVRRGRRVFNLEG